MEAIALKIHAVGIHSKGKRPLVGIFYSSFVVLCDREQKKNFRL